MFKRGATLKVLITGSAGQVGKALVHCFPVGWIICATSKNMLDITNRSQTERVIRNFGPDVIIHAAGYTDVDSAEDNVDICRNVNICGTENIARAAKSVDASLVFLSTDYVFSGHSQELYKTVDSPSPINVYGKSKAEAEAKIAEIIDKYFIVRTSWIFGDGNNFVRAIAKKARICSEIQVVEDQIGSPTYANDLAMFLYKLVASSSYGIYHATNEGVCSRAEFAVEIISILGLQTIVRPILSEQYVLRAMRPNNSCLSKESLDIGGFQRLPSWQNALNRYLKEI